MAFIGQEAMHGREHEEYNQLMDAADLPARKLERYALLRDAQKLLPHSMQLSATIALERFTPSLK